MILPSDFILGVVLGLVCGLSLSALLALIMRQKLLAAKRSDQMCKDLVADLARSERERKLTIKGILEAGAENDALRDQKRGNWGVPDGMEKGDDA